MSVRESIRKQLPEGAIVFDNAAYDNSIIGTTTDDRVVYSYEKMVAELMSDMGMKMQEAIDWIEYNTIRMLPYLNPAPVIMYEKTWISKHHS